MLIDVFAHRTCEVERITDRVSDGAGGWVEQWTQVGELTGSLQPSTGSEQTAGDTERAEVGWRFYCDPGSDVARDDVLVFAGDVRYRVTHVVRWQAADSASSPWAGVVGALDHDVAHLDEVQTGR